MNKTNIIFHNDDPCGRAFARWPRHFLICEKSQRSSTGLSCPSELKLSLRLRSTVPLGSPPLLPPALTPPDANWSILPAVVPANRTGSPLVACVQATQVKSDSSWEQISAMSLHLAEIQYIDKARVGRRIPNWKSCRPTKTMTWVRY